MSLNKELNDIVERATILNNIGTLYFEQGSIKKSLKFYQQALSIDNQLGDKRGRGIRLSNIGNVFQKQGRLEEALEYYKESVSIAGELGNFKIKNQRLKKVKMVLDKQKKDNNYQNYTQFKSIIIDDFDELKRRVILLNDIGLLSFNMGFLNETIYFFAQAVNLAKTIHDDELIEMINNRIKLVRVKISTLRNDKY